MTVMTLSGVLLILWKGQLRPQVDKLLFQSHFTAVWSWVGQSGARADALDGSAELQLEGE